MYSGMQASRLRHRVEHALMICLDTENFLQKRLNYSILFPIKGLPGSEKTPRLILTLQMSKIYYG